MCTGNVEKILTLVGTVYDYLILAAVVGVIIFGTLDFVKALMAGKDDEIKKAQGSLIKKITAMVIILLIWLIIKVVLDLITEANLGGFGKMDEVLSCINKFFGFK